MARNLEELINAQDDLVAMFRNNPLGMNNYSGNPPPEFSNWRDEQEAWQKSCVLFDLSYHMNEMMIEGPDAFKLLSQLAYNSFAKFPVDSAKQFAPVTHDGFIIGDVILFRLAEETFKMVGRAPAMNWVRFHAEKEGYNVSCTVDLRTVLRKDKSRRTHYRYQVQGPAAMEMMKKAVDGELPEIRFFRMGSFSIAGRQVRALRHGMVGQPGYEMFGPWEDKDAVLDALLEAGVEFDLKRVGGRAYFTNTFDSGWIPTPLPAIYTGEKQKALREWLPADGYEGTLSIGGSMVSKNIEDYYFTPYDLGYGGFVKFDHDFIGREALEDIAAKRSARKKVTLELNTDDVMRVIRSQFEDGERGKFIELPVSAYAVHPYDAVSVNGERVGVSTWIGYNSTARRMLSLAVMDEAHADIGGEVTLVWGEENGGTAKPTVERHKQFEIRCQVHAAPYVRDVRENYTKGGWRAQAV